MSILSLRRLSSIALLLAVPMAAVGAEPQTNSHACSTVVDPAERLACYDTAFPPARGVRAGAINVEEERAKALRNFGLNKAQLNERVPEYRRDSTPERIEAKVLRVTSRATGERVVTLDNDQIWLLTETSSKGRLRAGDPVSVHTAALGTYMLVTGRISLRAKRIR